MVDPPMTASEFHRTTGQHVDRRTRDATGVGSKNAVPEDRRLVTESTVLDRDSAAAGLRVVFKDFNVDDFGGGATKNFDPASV